MKCMASLGEECIKCSRCSTLIHLRCSDLPEYMLLRLKTSQASFICRGCVLTEGIPESLAEQTQKIASIVEKEEEIIKEAAAEAQSVKSDGAHSDHCEASKTSSTACKNPTAANKDNNNKSPILNDNRANCRYYLRGNCKHGRKGAKCPFKHPPLCLKFVANADMSGGCKKGSQCKYVHPRICWSYKTNKLCTRNKCNFYHIKGSRFEESSTTLVQQPTANLAPRPQNSRGVAVANGARHQCLIENFHTPHQNQNNISSSNTLNNGDGTCHSNDFLDLKMQITVIQEQLKLLMGYRIPPLTPPKQMGWGHQPQ